MELGMIGLGRMGGNMARRLIDGGHVVTGYARHEETVKEFEKNGGRGASSLEKLVSALPRPRTIWLMVPSGKIVDGVIDSLVPLLDEGDTVVEGGNSNYRDTMRRAAGLAKHSIDMVDAGTSGGIWGLKEGYSLMIGGEPGPVERLRPIFETLAPAPDRGWGHVGPGGAGHFVKMIHNGIEYGMMQAYAEGFNLLRSREGFDLDLEQISRIWGHGSVVRSWLLELIADSLAGGQDFEGIAPFVADSGEGRWTVDEAISLGVPAPVITTAVMERFRSQGSGDWADKLLAALRDRFGGHGIKEDRDEPGAGG